METNVRNLLADNKITYNFFHLGETVLGAWKCDAWTVTIKRADRSESFRYHTGTGHRKNSRAVTPEIEGVLHGLVMDYRSAQDTFKDFCECFGYDQDSRKALQTYLDCQDNGNRLLWVIGGGVLAEVEALLEDY